MSNPYKKRSPITVMRGLAHWLEIFILGRGRVRVSIREHSLQLYVKADTIFSWHLSKYRQWEPEITQWMLARYSDRRINFIDVGANFGWFSCVLSRACAPRSRLIAIEPGRESLGFLRENVALNSIDNIEVVNRAMGATAGTAVLHPGPRGNPGMHSLIRMEHLAVENSDAESVEVSTLDHECSRIEGRIDLVKIDVEGYELDVLRGAVETLNRVETLVLEYSPAYLRAAGNDPYALIEFLADRGFDFFEVTATGLEQSALSSLKRRTEAAIQPFAQWMLVCQRSLGDPRVAAI
jgi:FkbM family methyltransferase